MRRGEPPRTLRQHAALVYPGAMLGVLFLVPFAIMIAVSLYHRVEQGFYEPGFEFTHYARFFTSFFSDHLLFSLFIAALASALCVLVGFPFTYALVRLGRRAQIPILVLLLSVLSLSEVIVGFAWSVLLSKNAGLSNLLVWIGLLAKPLAWSPSFGAVLCGLSYLTFPYTILVLYPPLSRLDREMVEAARTLGASPARTFATVVIPVLRPAILAAFILGFVFTLGSYLTPQILGRPQHWTLSVLITDQAIYAANIPFAAAMAMFLTLVSLALVAATLALNRSARRTP
ncbi:MAG: ABC transporter permease [Alphaproteobacteria bacterium]|nr:ABC transporter permease [Alphaproteobacteria bacterium]